ncbi:CoA ester lyase [Afipia carboxidovorans]|uniref:HpcH/HpaI aldolase/citrate lyase family protein n=1 Tax=Afipia carboxidovorans TaxID=40137 RepID=UPI00308BBC27|nr:CoA ester lyase [Afipia carboxidovorans]
MIRPRRSVLFMPGSNARALEKARSLPADGLIFDLEDSVAPDAKPAARAQIAQAMAQGGFGGRERIIRTNAVASAFWQDDSALVAQARPDACLVPKVTGPQDIAAIGARLDALGADSSIKLWVMIETPLAVLRIAEIAACAGEKDARLAAFVIGPNDISLDTRIRMTPGRAEMVPLFLNCVVAARSYGIEILDGPYSDFSDAEGFAAECAQARDLGFDGKTLIHPAQIEAANRIFKPTDDELAEARGIIAAFAQPEAADKGAIRHEGRMVERLHAEMARRTLAMADAIEKLEQDTTRA